MTKRELFEKGREVGAAAFKSGKKCVPHFDTVVCGMYAGKTTKEVLALLKGWHRGWAEANVAAPVVGLES